MIQSFNDAVSPRRIMVLKQWAKVIIRPSAPVRIATSQYELQANVGNLFDGLVINPPAGNADIFQISWLGEMWMIAVNPNTQAVVLVPGFERTVEL